MSASRMEKSQKRLPDSAEDPPGPKVRIKYVLDGTTHYKTVALVHAEFEAYILQAAGVDGRPIDSLIIEYSQIPDLNSPLSEAELKALDARRPDFPINPRYDRRRPLL